MQENRRTPRQVKTPVEEIYIRPDSPTLPRAHVSYWNLNYYTDRQRFKHLDTFPYDLNLTTLFLRVELPLSVFPGKEPAHPPVGVAATWSPSDHLVYGN